MEDKEDPHPPFGQITIASTCNRDLRFNRMEENTITPETLYGWRLDVNHSKAAMEWLTFEEERLCRDTWWHVVMKNESSWKKFSWKQVMIAPTCGSASEYSMVEIRASIAF